MHSVFYFSFHLQYAEREKILFIILKLENQSENEYIILKAAAESQVGTYPKKKRQKMRNNIG